MRETTVLGCDFGASLRAGDQAKKNILIEAVRLGPRDYVVTPSGRNARLVRRPGRRGGGWAAQRRGWTVPELAESLEADRAVAAAAFDFPFGVPLALLNDPEFGAAVGSAPFGTRGHFVRFVAGRLPLAFDSPLASGAMSGLRAFAAWRRPRFWVPRATDAALRGAPPLKHVPPNVFNMTLAGVVLVDRLTARGYTHGITAGEPAPQVLCETYCSAVARVVGATRADPPERVLALALDYLQNWGVRLELARPVARFCVDYRTAGDDPDGLDAFLCLVTAIAFREGFAATVTGGADLATLREEGVIYLPMPAPA